MGQRWCPNCPGPSASLGGEREGSGGPRGFLVQMQMRHGSNYLIGMKWGGKERGFHSTRITLIVLTVSKYKACAMP